MKRPRISMMDVNDSYLTMAQDVPLSHEEQRDAGVPDATFSPRKQLLTGRRYRRLRTNRHHTYPSASAVLMLLLVAVISCSAAREIVETETIALSGTRRLNAPMSIVSTPSSLRRRAAVSDNDTHGGEGRIQELTSEIKEVEHEIKKDILNIEEELVEVVGSVSKLQSAVVALPLRLPLSMLL